MLLKSHSGPQGMNGRAWAAAFSSVMVRARGSGTPRKMPGKPSALMPWLGKSLRPVPAMRASGNETVRDLRADARNLPSA